MILLADSGSTKTDWLLYDTEVVTFQSAGFNPFYQSIEEILKGLQHEVVPNIKGSIDSLFFYGAGCADEISSRPITEALAATFPSVKTIEVNSDLLAAARALCQNEAGIACILGTGSNNCLYDGEKIINNIGSLGFWLGDEGSGGYLGKQLVVRYLHGELPTELQEDFASTYPAVSRLMVLDRAYKQPFPNRFFAGFTPFLSRHASHPFVHKNLTDAFGAFLETYVCKHPNASTFPVHFTGSIAYYFETVLREITTKKGLQMGSTQRSPMHGLLCYHQTVDI